MGNNKFVERGNASKINEVCYSVSNIPMIRYETLVDFCINEPALIHVFKNNTDNKIICEPILKLIVDVPNEHLRAFTVYSDERESFSKDCCMVLRQIFWDKQSDINELKQFPEKRTEFLTSWPSIISKNIVFRENRRLVEMLEKIDKIINHGIILENRAESEVLSWRDIEIMRRYEWGEIRNSWGTSMQNLQVEKQIFNLADNLFLEIDKEQPMVNKIELDYRFPIDLYQKIVCNCDL
jgi:hypothetical protein